MTTSEEVTLLNLIRDHFELHELEELALLAGARYDELTGEALTGRVISLIEYCRHRSLLGGLVLACRRLRPNVVWPDAGAALPRESRVLVYRADSVVAPDLRLIGRDEILTHIDTLLDVGRKVLLHGAGGMGKTSIAQTVVKRRLAAGREPVFWLEAGDQPAETLFDAVAAILDAGARSELRDLPPDAREWAFHALLDRHRPALLVVDNVWNGAALFSLLQALPEDVPALVTSRQVMPVPERIAVDHLSPAAALDILSHYAGIDIHDNPHAAELSDALGYHPYALEMAGAIIRVDGQLSARRLRTLRDRPHDIAAPVGFNDRPTLVSLLQQSYQALDADAQAVLRAVGALYAPGATPELLAACLGRAPDDVWEALERLEERSLASANPTSDVETGETVDYYTFHDLTFSFAHSLTYPDGTPPDLTAAVAGYVAQQAGAATRLNLDLANLLATARHGWAAQPDAALSIVSDLALGSHMRVYGHTPDFLALLDQAIDRLGAAGDDPRRHYLLGKRGNAYFERGEWARALEHYQATLATAPNDTRRAMVLAVIGRTHYYLNDRAAGDDAFAQARALAETQDDGLKAFVLEMQSWAAGVAGDYEAAHDYATQEAALARGFNDAPERLVYSLLNLGSVEVKLNHPAEALRLHEEAHALLGRTANIRLRADVVHALGIDLARLGRPDEAHERLNQACEQYRQIGNTAKELEVSAFLKQMDSAVAGVEPAVEKEEV